MQSKLSKNEQLSSFSIFHNNVLSINKNLENLQTQILEELEFHFDIIGISETKITNSNSAISVPTIPGYNFEFVPTPLASGGVALFIDDRHGYRILEKASNEAFQALWVEISFVKKKKYYLWCRLPAAQLTGTFSEIFRGNDREVRCFG